VGASEAGAWRESLINASDEDVWGRSFRNPDDVRRLSRIGKRGQVAKHDDVRVRHWRAQDVDEICRPPDFVADELEHPRVDLPGLRVISDKEHPGRWTGWTADSHRGAIILSKPTPQARSFGPVCWSVQPHQADRSSPGRRSGGSLQERLFANAISGLPRKKTRNKFPDRKPGQKLLGEGRGRQRQRCRTAADPPRRGRR
jgi:hypothetical protein